MILTAAIIVSMIMIMAVLVDVKTCGGFIGCTESFQSKFVWPMWVRS